MSGWPWRASRAFSSWAPALPTSCPAVSKSLRWTARIAFAEKRIASRQSGSASSREVFFAAKFSRTRSMIVSSGFEMSGMWSSQCCRGTGPPSSEAYGTDRTWTRARLEVFDGIGEFAVPRGVDHLARFAGEVHAVLVELLLD